jgi:hypothetical protein
MKSTGATDGLLKGDARQQQVPSIALQRKRALTRFLIALITAMLMY